MTQRFLASAVTPRAPATIAYSASNEPPRSAGKKHNKSGVRAISPDAASGKRESSRRSVVYSKYTPSVSPLSGGGPDKSEHNISYYVQRSAGTRLARGLPKGTVAAMRDPGCCKPRDRRALRRMRILRCAKRSDFSSGPAPRARWQG
jgi:hypothetical protein